MTSTLQKQKGPASVAADPSRGSNNPSQDIKNMQSNTTDALRLAMGSLDTAESFIHAAWMAARSLDGDNLPAGEALQAVIALAGDNLGDVRNALRKVGVA